MFQEARRFRFKFRFKTSALDTAGEYKAPDRESVHDRGHTLSYSDISRGMSV